MQLLAIDIKWPEEAPNQDVNLDYFLCPPGMTKNILVGASLAQTKPYEAKENIIHLEIITETRSWNSQHLSDEKVVFTQSSFQHVNSGAYLNIFISLGTL